MRLTATKYFLLLQLVIAGFVVSGQSIELNYKNASVSEVFKDLKQKYNVEFSYNPNQVEGCTINYSGTHKNVSNAISNIFSGCALDITKKHGVYIVSESTPYLKGTITNFNNGEPLVFAQITINGYNLYSDENGHFSFKLFARSYDIQIRHLGFQSLDTNVTSFDNSFHLKPKFEELGEFTFIDSSNYQPIIPVNEVKSNHELVPFIAGNNNNYLLSYLRLQPGIMAAGEQNKDYIIWGSYRGQTKIEYDGMTVFKPSSNDENIGTINPLMIGDISIYKGSYNVDKGDRVGGLVKINSKTGSNDQRITNINLSSDLINLYTNVPLNQRSNLQIGARRTTNFNLFREKKPDFNFSDLNVKYKNTLDNGNDLQFTFMQSWETSNLDQEFNDNKDQVSVARETESFQRGGALRYTNYWKKGGATSISLSSTSLANDSRFQFKSTDNLNGTTNLNFLNKSTNEIQENNIRLAHDFLSTSKHQIQIGGNITDNSIYLKQDSSSLEIKGSTNSLKRANVFFKDHIQLNKKIWIEPGTKITITENGNTYHEPRLLAGMELNKIKIFGGMGQYAQFISVSPFIEENGNEIYHWVIRDKSSGEALQGIHNSIGTSTAFGNTKIKIEAYHKELNNLLRYTLQSSDLTASYGNAKTNGIDLYVEQSFQNHFIWFGYSLGQTLENFDYFSTSEYERAPHDQRHEFKAAGVFNFSPIILSTSYVYGSGIPSLSNAFKPNLRQDYRRMDISAQYQLQRSKTNWDLGLSILNVFNTENVQYNNFSVFPGDKKFHKNSLSRRANIFVNLRF